MQLTVQATVENQLEFCTRMDRGFKVKKLKRKFNTPGESEAAEDTDLSRASTGEASHTTITSSLTCSLIFRRVDHDVQVVWQRGL